MSKLYYACLLVVILFCGASCKKGSSTATSTTTKSNTFLYIQPGAASCLTGKSVSFTAIIIDKDGNAVTPPNIKWEIYGYFNTATLSSTSAPTTIFTTVYGDQWAQTCWLKATVTISPGTSITSMVPISIAEHPQVCITPSVIIRDVKSGNLQLQTTYLAPEVPQFIYTSTDESVASVSGTGEITFHKAGTCAIGVATDTIYPDSKVYVPVSVTNLTDTIAPIVRIEMNNLGKQLFAGGTATFAAKAYNGKNAEVSTSFTWSAQDPQIAAVDGSGHVTALRHGKTMIYAVAKSIYGQAEINVLPDTFISINPAAAGIPISHSKTFVANVYTVDHATKLITAIPAYPVVWSVADTSAHNVSVNTSGVVTASYLANIDMKATLTARAASPTVLAGKSALTIQWCQCDSVVVPGLDHVYLSASFFNFSMSGTHTATLAPEARDASNHVIATATFQYCSSDNNVCAVDSNGNLTARSTGFVSILVCCGTVMTTVNVDIGD